MPDARSGRCENMVKADHRFESPSMERLSPIRLVVRFFDDVFAVDDCASSKGAEISWMRDLFHLSLAES